MWLRSVAGESELNLLVSLIRVRLNGGGHRLPCSGASRA